MAKVTVPEWARREGISKVAAYKRIKSGKVTLDKNRLIDTELAARQWNFSKDARQQARNHPPAKDEPEQRTSLAEAQRAREWLRVRREKVALETLEGKLVNVDDVNAFVAGMIIHARDEMLRIGTELRDRLAQETDPIRCEDIIRYRLERVLNGLAEYRRPDRHAAA